MESAGTRARILPRVAVPTRDGVSLATDVYLPVGAAPAPVVVVRTPYGRNAPFMQFLAVRLSAGGYAVVLQDSRGRYQSQGEFQLTRECDDGYDTLAWLGGRDWCDGRAALVGLSITSYPCFRLATSAAPPGVRIETMVNVMGAANLHRLFYRDGALLLHWALPWCLMMSPSQMGRTGWQQLPWAELYRHLPLSEALEAVDGQARGLWPLIVQYPACEGFWDDLDATSRLEDLRIPVLHVSGWHDFLLAQVLDVHARAARLGHAPQKLVVGPWDHQTLFAALAPPRAAAGPATSIDMMAVIADWLERHMPAEEPRAERAPEAAVLVYLMERGVWLAEDAFPPPGAEIHELFLESDGHANTSAGDGRLVPAAPARTGQDSFVFDPEQPVPTTGGAVWPFAAGGLQPGPADQGAVESRPDVLVYTSAPLDDDWVVLGPVRLELWAASSAPDTDFTGKLVDVDPLGTARIVQDGILRARFRGGCRREEALEPLRPVRFDIDLQASAHCFRRGHRLRLEVSSSNFPKFERNLNTAHLRAARPQPATQYAFHGGATPSRLRLPRLPESALRVVAQGTQGTRAAAPVAPGQGERT